MAKAGTSSKTAAFLLVDIDVREDPNQVLGYSPGLLPGIFSGIPAKSLEIGHSDTLTVEVRPLGSPARVHVSALDPSIAKVLDPSVGSGPAGPVSILGVSKGTTFLEFNLGGESGPVIARERHELRVFERRTLSVGVRVIMEENDDVQAAPKGGPPSSIGACVVPGPNLALDTLPTGDDVEVAGVAIGPGKNGRCDTVANDVDIIPVNFISLPGTSKMP